jgi:alkyldihydroxyacetonephosphate synthase
MTHDNTKAAHSWGFEDTQFIMHADKSVQLTGDRYEICGFRMPDFIPFVEDSLGVRIDPGQRKETVEPACPEPRRNQAFIDALKRDLPEAKLSFENEARLIHSHGQATGDEVYRVLYERLPRVVDLVFFCSTEQEAETLVRLALQHDVCLIPYGGGTNVSGCLQLPETERRMIVSVDMRGLNRIEWVNRENRQVCVQAGITGLDLERALGEQGLTSGHEPDSVEFSTLGGWISTNASGMKKNRYGNIEDIVESVTLVTPNGKLETLSAFPRQSAGIQVRPMLFGSEGNFGLITKAVIKVRPAPERRSYQSVLFPSAEHGVAFLHELSNSAFLPASIRLVDNNQFRFGLALKPATGAAGRMKSALQKTFIQRVKGIDVSQMAVATIVMEGSLREVEVQETLLSEMAARHRGFMAGAHNGKRGYNLTFAIAYIRDFLAKLHVLGETFETTLPWDKIHKVNAAVIAETKKIHEDFGLPGKPFISYRITQLYPTGVCTYYTYGIFTHGIANPGQVAVQADHRLRAVVVENGGAVSHHHGVGKFRHDLLAKVLPAHNADLVMAMKETLDPKNVFGASNGVFFREATH